MTDGRVSNPANVTKNNLQADAAILPIGNDHLRSDLSCAVFIGSVRPFLRKLREPVL